VAVTVAATVYVPMVVPMAEGTKGRGTEGTGTQGGDRGK